MDIGLSPSTRTHLHPLHHVTTCPPPLVRHQSIAMEYPYCVDAFKQVGVLVVVRMRGMKRGVILPMCHNNNNNRLTGPPPYRSSISGRLPLVVHTTTDAGMGEIWDLGWAGPTPHFQPCPFSTPQPTPHPYQSTRHGLGMHAMAWGPGADRSCGPTSEM